MRFTTGSIALGLGMLASARSVLARGRDAAALVSEPAMVRRQPPQPPPPAGDDQRRVLFWWQEMPANRVPFVNIDHPGQAFHPLPQTDLTTATERRTMAYETPNLMNQLDLFDPNHNTRTASVAAEADIAALGFHSEHQLVFRMQGGETAQLPVNEVTDRRAFETVVESANERLMVFLFDAIQRNINWGRLTISLPDEGRRFSVLWGIGTWLPIPADSADDNGSGFQDSNQALVDLGDPMEACESNECLAWTWNALAGSVI